jgi:glyoxylase-like metal-dependent hydrolase (beta-lactamase superfamily II)
MGTYIGPGVFEIDTLLGGWSRVTAGYLIEGPAPVLIETGSQSSVPALLEALEQHGVARGDLAGVAVTHIHLDHAGGVGDVARAFPQATVYVHERGARHLVNPERLVNSAALVYGDLLDSLYGRLDPTPADRIHVLEDGETIDIGPGRTLTTIDSPGHAKHHLALHDSESGILFAGDAVGVRLPDAGVLRPATPPADFDLDQAVHSLGRFRERNPHGVALAHYGLLPEPMAMLEEAEQTLRRWAETSSAPTSTRSTPRTGPSSRRSTASTPTRPASAAGSRPPRATRTNQATPTSPPGSAPPRRAGTASGRGRSTGRPRR